MTCGNEATQGHGEELMDIDVVDASNGRITRINENGLLLWPVSPQESGEGLPYAPVDWPCPGDIWGWRVGKRVAVSGCYMDRYLYLPMRFQRSRRKKDGFASKLSVEQYIRGKFPGTDVKAFFASFSWKIPSRHAHLLKDEHGSLRISSDEMAAQSPINSPSGVAVCTAGNRLCSSLVQEISTSSACDLCCGERGFCRVCCCILCCNTIDLSFEGYSFIRCAAIVSDGLICGHAAHLNCALRAYLGGTVGGSIGLDTEYYCRRCDSRTDLTSHVTNLLNMSESIESQGDVEKVLGLGYCILRGSQKKSSQKLVHHISLILQRLNNGSELKDAWNGEVGMTQTTAAGQIDDMNHKVLDAGDNKLHHGSKYLNIDNEICGVLEEFSKSQEQQFRIAQERLLAQKDFIFCLCQHIEKEKTELAQTTPSSDRDLLLSSIMAREEHVRHELMKLKEMEKISSGLGKTSKKLLKEHFDIDPED